MPNQSRLVYKVAERLNTRTFYRLAFTFSLGFSFLVVGCRTAAETQPPALASSAALDSSPEPFVSTIEAELAPVLESVTPVEAVVSEPDLPTPLPTPFYTGPHSPDCGQLLTAVPPPATPQTVSLGVDDATRAALQEAAPDAAWPALARLLDAPGTVGLVAYQLGQTESGVYLNENTAMPLASVVKLINLVAYSEAVGTGELNPLEQIPLAELDRYYLPNFDLGAHQRAIAELQSEGRVSTGDNPTVALEDVAWMMIRHSSNAASDYLHERLGQARIEHTAVDLGLGTQTAPCPFIGQFLLMGNHTRGQASDLSALRAYHDNEPSSYGEDVSLLTDAYANIEPFRDAEVDWRRQTRRPSIESQRYFTENLNAQGSAADYAGLMARLAQNGLNTPESSFLARRIVEWPMQFPDNQELFSNLGYKNGSLPGVLTTAYYAYRWNDAAPVIVILFYRGLPQETYRQWRRTLPHDELARWLLIDPQAIPLLRSALAP